MLIGQLSVAQSFRLHLKGDTLQFIRETNIPLRYISFVDCLESLRSARLTLLKKGYLGCSIDSLSWNDSIANAIVYTGPQYRWATLRNGNIPGSLLSTSRFNAKNLLNKSVSTAALFPVYEHIIRYFENHGYPFASVYLDSMVLKGDGIEAALKLDRGPLRKIDTILINEDARINTSFLLQYLGLKNGMLYHEGKIKEISTRIRELPFLEEAAPWRIEFNLIETKLNLYIKNKSANRADLLIGLLPNNEERGGKFLLTGDAKLAFVNALGMGEQLAINWQNLQYQSPRYNIDAQLPYLFKSPVGISGKFDFYKKDTSFKNVNGELGIIYQFSANEQVKVYYELASSRLLNINIPLLVSTRRLPELGDVTFRTFGIETQISRVDYKLNPRKGYRLMLNGSLSFRQVIKNTSIESTVDPILNKPFSYLYDSVKLKTFKYNLRGFAAHYTPLSKRIVLANTISAGYTFSTDPLYRNEVFQIGGYRLLRGFDEGLMFVNGYAVYSIEPRYLLSANSYFFLFGDMAFTNSKYGIINRTETPYSAGLGMSFETKAGLFNISYAIGARDQQAFQFRNSKVHFGYISFF
jgi:hemolysin activation/secretion protein